MQLSVIGDLQAIHRLSEHMRKFYNHGMARRHALSQKHASSKAARDRFLLLSQRLSRDQNFSKPGFESEFSHFGSCELLWMFRLAMNFSQLGYKHIMENCWDNARTLRKGVDRTGRFNITSKDIGVPLVAFSLNDSSQHTVFEIADQLRNFGSIVPAYTMPPDAQHITVLRVVVREDFNHGLAERLAADIDKVVKLLDTLPSLTTKAARVTAITSETDEKKIKKIAVETQRDIAVYWKRLVKGKRHGAC
ncbi:unnamed protein product [Sphenostylis stenocarpa]|uniref:Pyridoxal phosphate-dependent transferase n=1 Tax=Sphenostylis stenocarpa TaxID=92480 RepID=A0AA86SJV3_9FABA|nr:unnamed protein product [Sphenostylis stenocarpa]